MNTINIEHENGPSNMEYQKGLLEHTYQYVSISAIYSVDYLEIFGLVNHLLMRVGRLITHDYMASS